jgi:DNA-binding NtrC family response regulator
LLSAGEVERIGGTASRRVDVRLIVSVSPSLVDAPLMRDALPELVSRLRVFPIHLLPLRQRRDDIRPLAQHFLDNYARRNARAATLISPEALARLEGYTWPGNVRELENVVERAAILARGEVILPEHLSFQEPALAARAREDVEDGGEAGPTEPLDGGLTLSGRLDAIERHELIRALEKYRGNKAEVARALGIHRTTLYYRLKKLGIDA